MGRRAFWVRFFLAALVFILGLIVFRAYLPREIASLIPLPFQPAGPIGIIYHHSASPRRVGKVRIDAKRIDVMHLKKGYRIEYEGKVYHIGYHYVILPDGTIQAGRPELARGAHAHAVVRGKERVEYNGKYLGICLVGNFARKGSRSTGPSVAPTEAQIQAAISLTEKLIDKYDISLENIKRHRDVNETKCPGERFPYGFIMDRLKAYVASRKSAGESTAQLGTQAPAGG